MTKIKKPICSVCGKELLDFTGLFDCTRRFRCPRQCFDKPLEEVRLLDQTPTPGIVFFPMRLPNGHYRTAAGSEMHISGAHSGISKVEFDWSSEPDACCDCVPEPYEHGGRLHWSCDFCEGGSAQLVPVTPNV